MDGRDRLTGREIEVLQFAARGLSDKLIAKELAIARGTVSNHIGDILGKLQASNRAEAVAIALRDGVILPPQRHD